MDVFLADTDVTLVVPLVDRNGNALNVSAIEYRVIDQEGVEVLPKTALVGFVANSPTASVAVPALKNAMPDNAISAMRTVELYCTIASNIVMLHGHYLIQTNTPLVAGANSFQTLAQAEFTATQMAGLIGWINAYEHDRIMALMEARRNICQLSFSFMQGNVFWGQDSLNYVPEGSYPTQVVGTGGMWIFNGDLSLLNADQFDKLPARFKEALRFAQVAEADSLLGGDPMEQRRRQGLITDKVGESTQQFREGKPLELPVSRRALRYLSVYVSFAKRIGRA